MSLSSPLSHSGLFCGQWSWGKLQLRLLKKLAPMVSEISSLDLQKTGLSILASRAPEGGFYIHALSEGSFSPAEIGTLVELFVALGGDVDARDKDGKTALHLACLCSDIPLVFALLKSRANPQPVEPRCGSSPLHLAVEEDRPSLVAVLLSRGADPNLLDLFGKTPLHVACLSGSSACVGLLVEAGSDPLQTFGGCSSINLAGQMGFRQTLGALVGAARLSLLLLEEAREKQLEAEVEVAKRLIRRRLLRSIL